MSDVFANDAPTRSDGLVPAFADPPADTVDEQRVLGSVLASMFGDETLPEQIDRYVIEAKVGSGGLGVVYAARDPVLGRRVAIKRLHATATGEREQARLVREARALARVTHPNVITVYDAGTDPSGPFVFLVTELVDGIDLTRWLEQPRPFRDVLQVFIAAGRGLDAAHRAGLVHRDFKPGNVMLANDPEGANAIGRVCVLDFGLARGQRGEVDPIAPEREGDAPPILETVTQAGVMLGTPRYMAPEQHLGGEVDARSDQFAFCLSLWLAVYRESPYRATGEPLAQAKALGVIEAPPTAAGPRWLMPVLRRGLSPDPADRWRSMAELLARLERAQRPRRSLAIVAGVAVVLTAAVGLGTVIAPTAPASATVTASLRDPVLDEHVAAARTAMNEYAFTTAEVELRRAIEVDPADGVVRLYLALLLEHEDRRPAEVHSELVQALASDDLSAAQAAFAENFGHHVDKQYAETLAGFRAASDAHSDDALLLYGLLEGLFHAGHPDEILAVHRRIRAVDPDFTLHMRHVLEHCAAIDDLACVRESAVAVSRWGYGFPEIWRTRILARTGDPSGALAALRRLAPAQQLWVLQDLFMLSLREDRYDEVAGLGDRPQFLRLPGLAVAVVRGDEPSIDTQFDVALALATNAVINAAGAVQWAQIAAMLTPTGSHARLEKWISEYHSATDGAGDMSDRVSIVRLHVLAALDRRTELESVVARPAPEATAIVQAYRAGWRGDLPASIAAWRRAVALSPGPVVVGLALLELARVQAKSGDHRGVIDTCTRLLEPIQTQWSWASTAGPGLQLRAEAALALGEPDAARRDYDRLLRLRSAARPDDPLIVHARAALARL